MHPFCWSTRSFICHVGLGQALASDTYALAVHFLILACLRILKHTVIAIATHGNESKMMSCIAGELILKLHTGSDNSRETRGKGEDYRGYSDKFLQLLGLGRCGERPCPSPPDSRDCCCD